MQYSDNVHISHSSTPKPERGSVRSDSDHSRVDVIPLEEMGIGAPASLRIGASHATNEQLKNIRVSSPREITYTETRLEADQRKSLVEEGWQLCVQEMQAADGKMVKQWNEEIEVLLIFAGLFSAVVTTFVAQSFQGLQQSLSDQTPQILLQISKQLQSLSDGAQTANMTVSAYTPQPKSASSSNVGINICWFLSLVLSISVATFCIFVRQWMRYYNDWKVPSVSASESVRLRQARFMSLQRWQVSLVMSLLPLLLQVALGLFLAGLLILLWDINTFVAIATSSLSGILGLAVIFVSLHPVFRPFSPFKSPSSWIILTMSEHFSYVFSILVWSYKAAISRFHRTSSLNSAFKRPVRHVPYMMDWAQFDLNHLSVPSFSKRSSPEQSSRDQNLMENIFEWMHTSQLSGDTAHEVISKCAWSGDLRQLMNLIEQYGHTNPWGYGCAIITAIHLEADCHCHDTAPTCNLVHLPDLVDALYQLPSWEGSREDTKRYRGWNVLTTIRCGAMLRLLLDSRTKDHKITQTMQFREFMGLHSTVVEWLRSSDDWQNYARWPNRVCEYARINPGYFTLDQGTAMMELSLPSQHSDDDVYVYNSLTAAGRAVCAHYGQAAPYNNLSTSQPLSAPMLVSLPQLLTEPESKELFPELGSERNGDDENDDDNDNGEDDNDNGEDDNHNEDSDSKNNGEADGADDDADDES